MLAHAIRGLAEPQHCPVSHCRKRARLVGKRGTPTYAIYGASKFAVQGLYESLRLELGPAGVHVGLFSPGHVDTPLRQNVLGPDGKPWESPPNPPFRVWPVEKCVDLVIELLVKRKAELLLPWFLRPVLALDEMRDALGAGTMAITESIAQRGDGIRETFVLAVRLALDRVRLLWARRELPGCRPPVDTPQDLLAALHQAEGGQIETLAAIGMGLPDRRTPDPAPPPASA